MAPRGHKTATTGPLRAHSRSSSATRLGAANLQFTQKDLARPGDKAKKIFEGARPGLGSRTNSSQRIPPHQQPKRAATTTKNGTAQHKNGKTKGGGQAYEVIATEDDGDEDEWVSSESGAQTPNAGPPSGSDTASEGDVMPQLSQQLQRLQVDQEQVQEQQALRDYQEFRSHPPLARGDTLRQSHYNVAPPRPTTMNQNQNHPPPPPPPEHPALPPLIPRSQSAIHLGDRQHSERSQTEQSDQHPAHDQGGSRQPTHRRTGSRQNGGSHNHSHHHHHDRPPTHETSTAATMPAPPPLTKQAASLTRAPSSHSISSRSDIVRPHPLIRGYSQGHIHHALKHTSLVPLAAITDKSIPIGDDDDDQQQQQQHISTSPTSIRTSVTSPTSHTHDPDYSQEGGDRDRNGRRTSFSSVRSVSTLPAYTHTQATATFVPTTPTNATNHHPQGQAFPSTTTLATASAAPHRASYIDRDRTRTLSMLSTASSAALSSLVHLPSSTRPSSPQGPQPVSFFPPVNPHLNTEAIHPLLPGPYLTNHLTILAKRTPLRESYDRVVRAKIASGR